MAFRGADLWVLGAFLLGTVLFGLWVGRGQRDLASYFLGDRDLPWWAILGSIVATETSTVTFLSPFSICRSRREVMETSD